MKDKIVLYCPKCLNVYTIDTTKPLPSYIIVCSKCEIILKPPLIVNENGAIIYD